MSGYLVINHIFKKVDYSVPTRNKTLNIDLNKSSINDVNKIGGKAANFAELLNAFKDTIYNAPVPEGYFAIPFYFYENHLISNGLDSYISNMLKNSNFITNSAIRKNMLKKLQELYQDVNNLQTTIKRYFNLTLSVQKKIS